MQFMKGHRPETSTFKIRDEVNNGTTTLDDFFMDSNNVLLVLSDMKFKKIEEFASDDKLSHALKEEIDGFIYSNMTMEQVCPLLQNN